MYSKEIFSCCTARAVASRSQCGPSGARHPHAPLTTETPRAHTCIVYLIITGNTEYMLSKRFYNQGNYYNTKVNWKALHDGLSFPFWYQNQKKTKKKLINMIIY